jgi:hypothetical protein
MGFIPKDVNSVTSEGGGFEEVKVVSGGGSLSSWDQWVFWIRWRR